MAALGRQWRNGSKKWKMAAGAGGGKAGGEKKIGTRKPSNDICRDGYTHNMLERPFSKLSSGSAHRKKVRTTDVEGAKY